MSSSLRWKSVAVLSAVLGSLASVSPAFGQVAEDYQAWVGINGEVKMDAIVPRLRLAGGFESRSQNQPRQEARLSVTGLEEQNPSALLVFRGQVGAQLHPLLTAWMGYLFVPILFFGERREDILEHRIFEQTTSSVSLGPFHLALRVRFEHRFRSAGDNALVRQGEGQWAHRLRQQLRCTWTPIENNPWRVILADEFFVHLNDTNYPTRTGPDQNRAFIGFGYRANPSLGIEAGYMNQWVNRFTDRTQINHVLVVTLNFGFEAPAIAAPMETQSPAAD